MPSNDAHKLRELLEYVKANDRVCPMPIKWNELYEILHREHRVENGWHPPLPLILAAWYDTPALLKILRLQEHIEYAAQNGALAQVDEYLRHLNEEDWAHLGEF